MTLIRGAKISAKHVRDWIESKTNTIRAFSPYAYVLRADAAVFEALQVPAASGWIFRPAEGQAINMYSEALPKGARSSIMYLDFVETEQAAPKFLAQNFVPYCCVNPQCGRPVAGRRGVISCAHCPAATCGRDACAEAHADTHGLRVIQMMPNDQFAAEMRLRRAKRTPA